MTVDAVEGEGDNMVGWEVKVEAEVGDMEDQVAAVVVQKEVGA